MAPTKEQARVWLDRWDAQQQVYVADRDERFAVIGDVVAAAVPDPARIVDLGCGPGSLAVRLAERFGTATVVGVDADPLLLGLATAGHDDRTSLRFVDADLRRPGWSAALEGGGVSTVDAVVSTTALHWLTHDELERVYAEVATLLRPGGVFVDGDHFATASPVADRLAESVRRGREARVAHRAENWEQWWEAVDRAPELADLLGERGAQPLPHHVREVPTLDDHVRLLRAARFAEVTTVWQHGDDRVLVALRG